MQTKLFWLSGVFAAGLFLALGATAAAPRHKRAVSLVFDPLPDASPQEAEHSVLASPGGVAIFPGGLRRRFAITQQELFRTGDKDSRGIPAGVLRDVRGWALKSVTGEPWVSPYADNNSAYRLKNGEVLLLTHLEDQPGGVMTTRLQPQPGGGLTPVRFGDVDTAALGGTHSNCAGAKTPWGSTLVSEEDYYTDPLWLDPATAGRLPQRHISMCQRDDKGALTGQAASEHARQGRFCTILANLSQVYHVNKPGFDPYRHGYPFEVTVDAGGNTRVAHGHKLFTLGKGSAEMALVMPDERTALLPEDGGLRGLFLFMADRRKDLSAGTLFMARFDQTAEHLSGSARLRWVRLGHNTVGALAPFTKAGLAFSDFWELGPPGSCPVKEGFRPVMWDLGEPLCLRLKDGTRGTALSPRFKSAQQLKNVAAFLEARRYGAWLGATNELHKTEGITLDPVRRRLYLAVSSVKVGLSKLPPGFEGYPDHLRFPRNDCGGVFELTYGRNAAVGSAYAPNHLQPLLMGRPLAAGEPGAEKNACDPALIAGPDNIRYIGAHTLLIGEDSDSHYHNHVWAYDTHTGAKERIMSLPPGAQVTGNFADLPTGEESWLFINAQGAFGERLPLAAGGQAFTPDGFKTATPRDRQARLHLWRGLPLPGP